jgi:hypothetical protein
LLGHRSSQQGEFSQDGRLEEHPQGNPSDEGRFGGIKHFRLVPDGLFPHTMEKKAHKDS